MSTRDRDYLLRLMAAALLQSDLTVSDMRRLRQYMQDDEFVFTLVEAVTGALVAMQRRYAKDLDLPRADNRLRAELLDVLDKRRISKRELMDFIFALSPTAKLSLYEGLSSREMVSRFLEDAQPHLAYELLTLLTGGKPQDPYLRDIIRKQGTK